MDFNILTSVNPIGCNENLFDLFSKNYEFYPAPSDRTPQGNSKRYLDAKQRKRKIIKSEVSEKKKKKRGCIAHKQFYSKCKVCNPKCMCIHGNLKYTCKDGCLCIHKRLKDKCDKCIAIRKRKGLFL